MANYRFIHASDLHLDSQFGVLSAEFPELAEILRRSTFDTYDRIVELCIEEKVDALLIAGDVFDSADNSLAAQLNFVSGLERLSQHGIKSFVCHGNHDPLDGWRAGLDWPEGAYQFGPEPHAIPFDETDPNSPVVTGVSYPTQEVRTNLVTQFPPPASNRPSIGLVHANVGADTGHENYAPCTIDDLTTSGYDYWALGHVHTRRELRGRNDGAPVVVYPGNSQGRHRNEKGPRGVYIVEMDEHGGVTALDFRPTDGLRWQELECAIDQLNTDQELINALDEKVRIAIDEADGRHLVYRMIMTGSGSLHNSLVRPDYTDDLQRQLNSTFAGLRPFALCEKIVDSSSTQFDRDQLASGTDFVADLLTLIDQIKSDPEQRAQLKNRAELENLFGHNRARRYLKDSDPDDSSIVELIDEAERFLLFNLIEVEDE
jgi:DNA repair exonuclease SbcCD nuclease subunit